MGQTAAGGPGREQRRRLQARRPPLRAGRPDAAPVSVEYRLLGPVEVWNGGGPLAIERPPVRALLAYLVLHANEIVTSEQLIDVLWEKAPLSSRNALQQYVSRLRAALQPVAGKVLVTRAAGYRLEVKPGQVDLHRFDATVGEARRALSAGRPGFAAHLLRTALALWRGPALAGTGSEPLRRTAGVKLEELRFSTVELRFEVEMELGRCSELVGELLELVAANPFRERLVEQLMVCLYRCGRRAEALQAYNRTRLALLDELGIAPGSRLQALQRHMLQADPGLDAPAGPGVTDLGSVRPSSADDDAARQQAVAAAPSQLPPPVAELVGRNHDLAAARRYLEAHSRARPGQMARLVTFTGVAGAGKTALALRLAHALGDRFPDGRLFFDLAAAGTQPRRPVEILAALLRALGVDGLAMPAALDERTALYRALLAHRRVLVVLDDAAGAEQVRPLLPSGPGSAAVITSRAPLRGLPEAHGARLGALDTAQAVQLLAAAAGPARVAAEPAAAGTCVDLCGRLPLALRIAGAGMAVLPRRPPRWFAARLAEERRRLEGLGLGDAEVRASLALGYRGLAESDRTAFRLLGLLETPDFAAWLAAGLLSVPVGTAEELLERLVQAHLLEPRGEDGAGQARYGFHGLLRVLARELPGVEEGP